MQIERSNVFVGVSSVRGEKLETDRCLSRRREPSRGREIVGRVRRDRSRPKQRRHASVQKFAH